MKKSRRINQIAKSLHDQGLSPGYESKRGVAVEGVSVVATAYMNRLRPRALRRAMARTEIGYGPWTKDQERRRMSLPTRREAQLKHNQRHSHNGWARRAIEKAKKAAEAVAGIPSAE